MKIKTLYSNKWFEVVEKEDNNEAVMVGLKPNQENVVVLPYTLNDMGEVENFGIVYECNPLRPNGYWYTCVTGGVDDNEDALGAARRELIEETGYNQIDSEKWQYVGTLFTSKLVDLEHPCFIVDITGLKQQKKKGDGTKNEALSNFKLVTIDKLILEEDCFILSMLMKFFVKNYSGIFNKISQI